MAGAQGTTDHVQADWGVGDVLGGVITPKAVSVGSSRAESKVTQGVPSMVVFFGFTPMAVLSCLMVAAQDLAGERRTEQDVREEPERGGCAPLRSRQLPDLILMVNVHASTSLETFRPCHMHNIFMPCSVMCFYRSPGSSFGAGAHARDLGGRQELPNLARPGHGGRDYVMGCPGQDRDGGKRDGHRFQADSTALGMGFKRPCYVSSDSYC
jgi:hypothetical protein